MLLSIVVPAYNESENVEAIFTELKLHVDQLPVDTEIIFIDDGSTDDTTQRVRDVMAEDDRMKLVRLSRNFGKESALMAGLASSEGDAVVMLDCDLQHPPKYIPQMFQMWQSGSLIVQMIRTDTIGLPVRTRVMSALFHWILSSISTVEIPHGAADFRLMDRHVINQLLEIGHGGAFMRGMIGWLGFAQAQLPYVADERRSGSPSQTTGRNFRLAKDSLTSLSKFPLRISLLLGVATAAISLGVAAWYLIEWILSNTIPGWPSIVIPILLLGSLQLIILGVMGEYLGLIYDRTRRMPNYVTYPVEKTRGPYHETDSFS